MTVAELIEKLARWPADAQVRLGTTWGNVREIRDIDYLAAYNTGFVVID